MTKDNNSENELARYAIEVRRRINECDGEVFRNKSARHASIILREFIESAKESVFVFCGQLNRLVYGDLLDSFTKVVEEEKQVRVVIEGDYAAASEVASYLTSKGALRRLRKDVGIPHFVVVDAIRYRLEIDECDKSALVCAYAKTEEQQYRAQALNAVSEILWDAAQS